MKGECTQQLEAIEKGKKLPDIVWDMIRTTGTDDLAQLAMMAGASKVGSIARLAALGRLEKAGITGHKALALAYGTEVLAEGTALWAMNTVYESMFHDTEKVFEGKKLLKSWGANIIMIAGLKGAGRITGKYAPQVAKYLNFVEKKKFTQTGMATVWGLNHFAGLGGMIATTQLNQALGLSEAPKGGFKESLAHDLFSYIKYGVAQKGVDRVLGADFVAARETRQEMIRQKEASLLAASQLRSNPYLHPLLSSMWMMLGVGGLGGGGGKKQGPYRRNLSDGNKGFPIPRETKTQITEFLEWCRENTRHLPSQKILDAEAAWEAKSRERLQLQGDEGDIFLDHQMYLDSALGDPARGGKIREILNGKYSTEERIAFQKQWAKYLDRSDITGMLSELQKLRNAQADQRWMFKTIAFLIEHLQRGPIEKPTPAPAPALVQEAPAPPSLLNRIGKWFHGLWK